MEKRVIFEMLNYYFLFFVLTTKFAFIDGYNEQKTEEYRKIKTPSTFFQFVTEVKGGGRECTGTIISDRHILTAAHCVYDEKKFVKRKRYQEYSHEYGTTVREGIQKFYFKIEPHSKAYVPITYKWNSQGSDIAIIEYSKGTNLDFEPVKLAKDYIEIVGDEAYIAEFEPEMGKDGNTTYVLHHTKTLMKTDTFGTLGIRTGVAGDNGGPMLIYRNYQWYQIGVNAEPTNSGAKDYHTRVSSYCNFIEEVTNVKCESIYPENFNNGQMLPPKHFEPIYKGLATHKKFFNFVVPLYNYYYNQGCTATVISRRHLLTSAYCVYREELAEKNSNIHVAEYWSYKAISSVLFTDFREKCINQDFKMSDNYLSYIPLNYKSSWDHNIAVIEFLEETNFDVEPVTLAKDYFQTYLEEIVVAGYGDYQITNKIHTDGNPPTLIHSNATFEIDSEKAWRIHFDNNRYLMEDEGGPVLIERNGKFYQIGVNYYLGTLNGSRTFVSNYCDFIDEVTKGEVQCESVLPVYDMPSPEPGTEQEHPAESNPQQPPIQTENEAKPSAAPLASALIDPHPLSMALKMYQLQFPLFSVISFLILFYL